MDNHVTDQLRDALTALDLIATEVDQQQSQEILHAAFDIRQGYERLLSLAVEMSLQQEQQAARSVA